MSEVKAGGDLIRLLEEEAVSDLSTLDLPSDQEDQINIEYVKDWYFETEKLIRVLANTLPSSMAQPINQLRYAGHHVLKANIYKVWFFKVTVQRSHLSFLLFE